MGLPSNRFDSLVCECLQVANNLVPWIFFTFNLFSFHFSSPKKRLILNASSCIFPTSLEAVSPIQGKCAPYHLCHSPILLPLSLCRPFSSYFSTRETNPTLLGVSLPLESLDEVQRGLKMPRMPRFLPRKEISG